MLLRTPPPSSPHHAAAEIPKLVPRLAQVDGRVQVDAGEAPSLSVWFALLGVRDEEAVRDGHGGAERYEDSVLEGVPAWIPHLNLPSVGDYYDCVLIT